MRFLESVVLRSFEELAFDCSSEVEILPLQHIEKKISEFQENVLKCAEEAFEKGIMVLCVHTDADDSDDISAFSNKMKSARKNLRKSWEFIKNRNIMPIPKQRSDPHCSAGIPQKM